MGFGLVQTAGPGIISELPWSCLTPSAEILEMSSYSTLSPSLWAYPLTLPAIVNSKNVEVGFRSWFKWTHSEESRI